nr:hypothetical protein [uncultured Rhodopila sp.]
MKIMRVRSIIALVFLVCQCADNARAQSAALSQNDVAAIASEKFGNLSIVDAQLPNRSLAWAAWDTGPGAQRKVHLALLTRKKTPTRVLWSRSWDESFQPAVTVLPGWQYDRNPMLALTFQQGAAAESLLIFGINNEGLPVAVAQRDAAVVELRSVGRGEFIIMNGSGSSPARECLVWNEGERQIASTACN